MSDYLTEMWQTNHVCGGLHIDYKQMSKVVYEWSIWSPCWGWRHWMQRAGGFTNSVLSIAILILYFIRWKLSNNAK